MKFKCPKCSKVSDHPHLKADAAISCGDCLMDHIEVVAMVPMCSYPSCTCIVITSTSEPKPVCPRGFAS